MDSPTGDGAMELFTLGHPQALRPGSAPPDGRVKKTVSTFTETVLPIHAETSGLALATLPSTWTQSPNGFCPIHAAQGRDP